MENCSHRANKNRALVYRLELWETPNLFCSFYHMLLRKCQLIVQTLPQHFLGIYVNMEKSNRAHKKAKSSDLPHSGVFRISGQEGVVSCLFLMKYFKQFPVDRSRILKHFRIKIDILFSLCQHCIVSIRP